MKSIDILLAELSFEIISFRGLSSNTALAYTRDISLFTLFLDEIQGKSLETCQKEDIIAYLAHLKPEYSPRSIARKVASLRFFFRFLHEKKYFENNLFLYCITPKIPKTLPTYLSLSQVKIMLSYLYNQLESSKYTDRRNALLLILLYVTGMRVSEVLNIKIKNVYQNSIKIMGKGNKERIIPVPEDFFIVLQNFILELPENQIFLFQKKATKKGKYSKDSRNKTPQILSEDSKKKKTGGFVFKEEKGVEVWDRCLLTRSFVFILLKRIMRHIFPHQHFSPHSLRHSIATHLLQEGMDLRHLQTFLGHQRIATVALYTHLDIKRLQNAYEAMHPRAQDLKEEEKK